MLICITCIQAEVRTAGVRVGYRWGTCVTCIKGHNDLKPLSPTSKRLEILPTYTGGGQLVVKGPGP